MNITSDHRQDGNVPVGGISNLARFFLNSHLTKLMSKMQPVVKR